MHIIDTHAHLDQIENIDGALKEAVGAGVEAVVAVGTDRKSNTKNIELKKNTENPKIFVALGVHPEFANSLDIGKEIESVRRNIMHAVAIGEIGLDYWYKWVKKRQEMKQLQKDVFMLQLKIAKEHNLPALIHSRGAWRDCFELTKEAGIKKAVFHWYSGPVDVLKDILKVGYFISATPSLAYSPQHQEAIKNAPIEQTLIETDSPVRFKNDQGGFNTTPQDVFRTLEFYSDLKRVDQKKAIGILNKNAKEFFGI